MAATVGQDQSAPLIDIRQSPRRPLTAEAAATLRDGVARGVRSGSGAGDVRTILERARCLEVELSAAGDSVGAALAELIGVAGTKLSRHLNAASADA